MGSRARPVAAEVYDQMGALYVEDVEHNVWNALYERPAMQRMLGPVAGRRVLDAGCGAGSLSAWLLEQGAKVVAVDASSEMVRIARDRLQGRVEVHRADLAQPLDFLDSDSFDVVAASLVMHYLEDWAPTLSEFHRVLCPSGRLVFSTHHPFMDFTVFERPDYFRTELLRDRWEKSGRRFEVSFYRRPLTQIVEPLLDAGFVVDGLLEPQPEPEAAERDPEAYERLSRDPHFLVLRALKR